MKKRILIGFTFLLSLGAWATAQAADPYGKYDSPVTINIGNRIDPTGKFPEGDSPENNVYTRYAKDTFNIIVKDVWQSSYADYDRKLNLAIASNDLPDAMVVNDAQLRQMLKADQLQDLTDVYAKYAGPLLKAAWAKTNGTADKAVTFNGKIMAIPGITVPDDGYTLAWIRKDWLDKLGLKVPQSLDDLEKVAKAFIDKNPGNLPKGTTIGIGGPQSGGQLYGDFLFHSTNNNFAFDPIFSAMGATPGYWIAGKDGKAVYGSIQPETKAALAKLADFYKKGLIDPEMSVRKDATEGIIAGQVGIFFGPWWHGYWPFPDAMKQNPNANWQAYAVPLNASGKWAPHSGNSHTQFLVVRKGYAHPEAAIKLQNGLMRDQFTFNVEATRIENYPIRTVIGMPDDLLVARKAALDVLMGKKKIEDFQGGDYRSYPYLLDDIKSLLLVKKPPFDNFDIQYWDTTSPKWPRIYSIIVGGAPYSNLSFKVSQLPFYSSTKTIETKWASLKKMEDETFVNIILGGKPLSAFDEFVTKWKAQGGDTITAEVRQELGQ